MTGAADSALLAVVDRSPDAVARHDRAGWVGLFGPDGRVEDPVGSRPHVGRAQIGRFYDTFIAPRRIVFHRRLDVVSSETVVREVVLEVAMGPVVTMRIPAVLRYDLRSRDGDWQIVRLRAYWELPAMMLRFLANGLPAVPQALGLMRMLLRHQGIRGTAGFLAGFRGARVRGKRTAAAFLDAIAAGDELRAWRQLAPGAAIAAGERGALKFGVFGDQLRGVRWTTMIAAGNVVTVALRGPVSGVLIAELASGGGAITRLEYFV